MRVVLGVADTSLGGTSRSALLFASLWRQAGADVLIYSPAPLHPRRAGAASAQGVQISSSLSEVREFNPALVHLHHAAPSPRTLAWVDAFADALTTDVVILTHNVFGQPLPLRLGSNVVIGVLGDWVNTQYRLQASRSKLPVRVMPNPQDFDFFRPPTAAERAQARAELGVSADERVVLRVGSPTEEKWSKSGYHSLAIAVGSEPKVVMRLIGAPPSFDFPGPRVTIVHEAIGDDALRREYWAADVFAHWAGRGESFGNVLLEALGTGLPVVYRAIRTRDNTPAEFRGLNGFEYVKTKSDWEKAVLRSAGRSYLAFDAQLMRYSADAVRDRLREIVGGELSLSKSEQLQRRVLESLPKPKRLRLTDLAAVSVRHNALTALLKRLKLRRST